MMITAEDERYMRMAIAEARKCKAEDARPRPLVGAVVVKNGDVIASAFRSELKPGEHAEYTALERKAGNVAVAGATVYTTLEPCTSRNDPKIACVERLVERKIARVVIGMLDPNPIISGKGQRRLRDANIVTDLFTPELMAEIEDMNRAFMRANKGAESPKQAKTTGPTETQPAEPVGDVLSSIDDRLRVVSRTQFEPKWEYFNETYWLIGPITIENQCNVAVSLDGYLEASHSRGPLRFDVDGIPFAHWTEAVRVTHQASARQLFFPLQVPARHKVRGITLVRFPQSELGGLGRYHEANQKLRFVLMLTGTDLSWSFSLRLPYEWNPLPPGSFGVS
jgi:pyrimidine deaminase RibD-like protein